MPSTSAPYTSASGSRSGATGPPSVSWPTSSRLTKGGSGWSDGYHLAYDASLQDMAARVKFAVAKDTEGTPLAGKQPTVPYKGIWLKAGKTMTTWAKFIVPTSTTTVDVTLPGASMPWNNVQISAP